MTELKPTITATRTVTPAHKRYSLTIEQLKEAMALYFEAKGVPVRNAEMTVIATNPRRDCVDGPRSSGVTVVLEEKE